MDVLVAHGAEASRRGLTRALAGGELDLREAPDGPGAMEILLADQPPRVAVIDWDLAGIEGPELCRLVRDFHLESPPYVILLAGSAHRGEVALGLESGANDCVRTPVTPSELRARVEMGRRFVELPWGRAAGLCPGDGVIGVSSREEIIQRLDGELARVQREGHDLGVGLLDVDGLGRIVETLGRPAADAVLRQVVSRARTVLRPYDAVGRLEAAELLVIVPGAGEPDLLEILDRMRRAMAGEPFSHAGRAVEARVTLGGAAAADGSAGKLIAEAREALARARAQGPDRVAAGREVALQAVLLRE
jgi:two-component system cell cycle response regulator